MISFSPTATPLRPPFTQTNNIKVSLTGITVTAVSHDFVNDLIVTEQYGATRDVVRYLGDLTQKHAFPLPASAGNAGSAYLAYSGKYFCAMRCQYISPTNQRSVPTGATNNVELYEYDNVANSYTKYTASFFPGNAAPFTSSSYICEQVNMLTTADGTCLVLVAIATFDGSYNGKQVTSRSFVRVFKFNGTTLTYLQDIQDSVSYPSNLTYIASGDTYSSPAVRSLVYDNVGDFLVISSAVYMGSGVYNPRSLVYKYNGTNLTAVSNLGTYSNCIVDGFTRLSNTNGSYGVMKSQPTTFPGNIVYRLYTIVGDVWTLVFTLTKATSYNASNTEFVSNDINMLASSEAAPTLSDLELYLNIYEVTADNKIVLRRVINRSHLGIPESNAVTIKRIPYIDFIDAEIFVCSHQYRPAGDTGFDLVKLSQNAGT